ncbi:MAG: hypothetical protein ACTSVU_07675, partial [Promethearchaeota archaeon]
EGTGNHTLDFGISLHNIDETDDAVKVTFGTIVIIAYEEDQYKVGSLGLNVSIDFKDGVDKKGWLFFNHLMDTKTKEELYIPLDYIDHMFNESIQATKHFEYNLTSRVKHFLNSSHLLVGFLIYNYLGDRDLIGSKMQVSFDDFNLSPYYENRNLSKIGLQLWNGTNYIDQTSWNINSTNTMVGNNFTLGFKIKNSIYSNSILKFHNNVTITRSRNNRALASYYVNDCQIGRPEFINWNVTYNNTDTFDQIFLHNFTNFDPVAYNFSLVDLPAYDNLGSNSTDWDWIGGFDPLGNSPSYSTAFRTNGTGNVASKQNSTVIDASAEYNGYLINGTWTLLYKAENYLTFLNLHHFGGSNSTRFYNANSTNIEANCSESIIGNYNISISNSSSDLLNLFPKYFSNKTGNLTESWAVEDEGVGNYNLIGIWNDTTLSTNQTTRIGVIWSTFEVWRQTNATLLINPPSLNSGDQGSFYFNFSQSNGNPISNAESYTRLFLDENQKLWGLKWAPHQYLVDSLEENSSANCAGNYTLTFKTRSVPTGNYWVYIKIAKPFFDERYLYGWINITGQAMVLDLMIGASNTTIYSGFIHEDNFPYVNDTVRSIIQVKLTNQSSGLPLRFGTVSGTFNGSDNVFYGDEIYTETQNPADRGLYNITLDGSGLNTTNRGDIFNYTLTITVSVQSFNTTYTELSTRVLPIITSIDATPQSSIYEAGSFDFFANYQNILDPANPLYLSNATLTWTLKNDSSTIAIQGEFSHLIGGTYTSTIELATETFYILPGIYIFEVNASQSNCENATWIQMSLEVIGKDQTNLTLKISENLQIGSQLSIQANLTFSNGSALSNEDLFFTLTYSGFDSLNFIGTTDNDGLFTYSQTIAFEYANTNLTITAQFDGDSKINSCNVMAANLTVRGKNNVSLDLLVLSEIRVGYSVDLSGILQIEGYTSYAFIFVTVAGYYDGNTQDRLFMQQIYPNDNGSFIITSPAIGDGHNNITFFVDYAGTAVNEYAGFSTDAIIIMPKWNIEFSVANFPSSNYVRIGQTISFNITAGFLNLSCIESLYGREFTLSIENFGDLTIEKLFFGTQDFVEVTYIIPQDCSDWMNISISFMETDTIKGFYHTFTYDVQSKWQLTLNFSSAPESLRQGEMFSLSVFGEFLNPNCTENIVNLPIFLTVEIGNTQLKLNQTLNENGITSFIGQIFIIQENELILRIYTLGTLQIAEYNISQTIPLLPQLQTRLLILDTSTKEAFSGEFHFRVQLVDETESGISEQIITFIVYNSKNIIVENFTSITNEEGIAEKTIIFNDIGNFFIEPTYFSNGIFAAANLASKTSQEYSVRVINYGILIIDNILYIGIAIGSVIVLSTVAYRGIVVPRRNRRRKALIALHQEFSDIENIQYIFIIHKETNVTVFSQSFSEIPIDETLISGFLSAISSFGKEIGTKMKQPANLGFGDSSEKQSSEQYNTGLEELAYQQFKIAVIEGTYVRSAVLLLKSASDPLKSRINDFNTEFEIQYIDILSNWKGQTPEPAPVVEIVERVLHADLLYQHQLISIKIPHYLQSVSRKNIHSLIIKEAENKFQNSFKVREMIISMAGYGKGDVDTFNAITQLRGYGIIVAVNPRTTALIEKFKPIIQNLKKEDRQVLIEMHQGVIQLKQLEQNTGIASIIPILARLTRFGYLTEENTLTEEGVVIATILGLVPDL